MLARSSSSLLGIPTAPATTAPTLICSAARFYHIVEMSPGARESARLRALRNVLASDWFAAIIFRGGDGLKMRWIHALSRLTSVIKRQTGRNRSAKDFVGEAMSVDLTSRIVFR